MLVQSSILNLLTGYHRLIINFHESYLIRSRIMAFLPYVRRFPGISNLLEHLSENLLLLLPAFVCKHQYFHPITLKNTPVPFVFKSVQMVQNLFKDVCCCLKWSYWNRCVVRQRKWIMLWREIILEFLGFGSSRFAPSRLFCHNLFIPSTRVTRSRSVNSCWPRWGSCNTDLPRRAGGRQAERCQSTLSPTVPAARYTIMHVSTR